MWSGSFLIPLPCCLWLLPCLYCHNKLCPSEVAFSHGICHSNSKVANTVSFIVGLSALWVLPTWIQPIACGKYSEKKKNPAFVLNRYRIYSWNYFLSNPLWQLLTEHFHCTRQPGWSRHGFSIQESIRLYENTRIFYLRDLRVHGP